MGVVKFLTVRFVEVIVVILLILFMPSIPPKANFTYFKVTPVQELQGKLAINERLNGVEHIYEKQLKGAEAFAEYNGELYSTLYSGDVVKLSKGKIVPVAKFGKPCTGFADESLCGRPLGLQIDKNGNLYVADAYYGIWKVDLKTGKKTLLVSMDEEIEGKKPMLPNSLTVSENGDIYWTDSSTEFHLEDGVFIMLADGTGRVIHYNSKTKTNKVLMDGLYMANGILLSSDGEFLTVSETGRSRIYRFYVKGPKAGTHDIFADGLPGMPDNINSDGQGGFLIPLVTPRDSDHPLLTQSLAPLPWIRKLAARILGITETSFKTLHNIYPNFYTQWAIHVVGHFETVFWIFPKRVTILHYSRNGELIESLHAMDKSIQSVSEAFIFEEDLYLGSPFNDYIGKISLAKVGLEHLRKKREIPTQAPTKTPEKITTPKPTAAPTKAPTQAPTQAPKRETAPPKPSTIKQAPPTPKPTPKPTPVKTEPLKEAPKPAPVKETPPKVAPVKEIPKPAPVKETQSAPVKSQPPKPAPVKEVPQKAAPVKEAPQKAAPVKQAPPAKEPAPVKESQPPKKKIVPIKENSVPKPRV